MYYYKQIENGELVSLQGASVMVVNLPAGFEEITENEFNVIMEELAQRAEQEQESVEVIDIDQLRADVDFLLAMGGVL